MPSRVPSGANTQVPPGPVQSTRPAVSTFIPSGTPSVSSDDMSAKMRRRTRPPAESSSSAWMYCVQRVLATYRIRSSGENASPFGYSQSATSEVLPSGAMR